MATLIEMMPRSAIPPARPEDRDVLARALLASLLTHAQAAVAAYRAGQQAPMTHLIGWLEEVRLLPPTGVPPEQLLARAHEADYLIESLVAELLGGHKTR